MIRTASRTLIHCVAPAETRSRMTMSTSPIVRRSARALLLDDQQRLVLIKRTKPEQRACWTSPGGIDDGDASVADALEPELAEVLGVTAAIDGRILLISSFDEDGVSVQQVFVARLRTLDETARIGKEWTDARRGGYEVVRVPIHQLDKVDLKPAALQRFVLDNIDVLVAEASVLFSYTPPARPAEPQPRGGSGPRQGWCRRRSG